MVFYNTFQGERNNPIAKIINLDFRILLIEKLKKKMCMKDLIDSGR